MKKIEVEEIYYRELDLVELVGIGMSFGICRALHRWPPLTTFNGFLRGGLDDIEAGGTLRWAPFEIEAHDYRALLAAVDAGGAVDPLGTASGDWQSWFGVAVSRLNEI